MPFALTCVRLSFLSFFLTNLFLSDGEGVEAGVSVGEGLAGFRLCFQPIRSRSAPVESRGNRLTGCVPWEQGCSFWLLFSGACESTRLVCVWFQRLSACVHSHASFGRVDGGGVTLPFNISAVSAISNPHCLQAATVLLNINPML